EAERRELRLSEARSAVGDSLQLGPGPKDPWRAVALSCEGTLAGLLFPPLLTVGPAAGQAYAGHFAQALVTSSIRAALLVGIGIAAAAFAGTASARPTIGDVTAAASNLNLALLGGGGGLGLLSAFDIATAYGEAQSTNARWERSVLGE
ncbi:MAG: hypothetical protein ACYCWW_17430, partial [Deltaproteobacteria bacterium]